MSRSSLRKLAAAGLGAALIGSGLTVGLGAGIASADTETCEKSASAVSTTGTAKYRLSQEIIGDSIVAPGGSVTYRTTVSKASGPVANVKAIGQFYPEGFTATAARANVYHAVGGQKWTDETPLDDATQNMTQVKAGGAGWSVVGSNTATLEVTYKVPASATPGDELRSGMVFDRVSASGPESFPDVGACVTIREKNAIEAATGSLDDIGLGSVNAGSSNIFGSATDPAGSVSNIVDGLDFGKIFGDILKSGS